MSEEERYPCSCLFLLVSVVNTREQDTAIAETVQHLLACPELSFGDWPNRDTRVPIAVYLISGKEQFLWAGVAGRPTREGAQSSGGLFVRLNAHASGQRSGDRFCIAVGDRLVLPSLTTEEIAAVGRGEFNLDRRIRQYVRAHLSYRFASVPDYQKALAVEGAFRRGEVPGFGKPILNPG